MDDRRRGHAARTAAPEPAPFWTRIPQIASYPLHGNALIALIALSIAVPLPFVIPMPPLWLLAFVPLVAIYAYALEIVRHTADGHEDAPELSASTSIGLAARMFALSVFYGAVIITATWLGGPGGKFVSIGTLALLQPGFTISLAMYGSLRRALNPMVPIEIALRIGWPYLAAFGLLWVIQGSVQVAVMWSITHLPPVVNVLAPVAAFIWALFASHRLLGHLVFQYHEALGYEPAALMGSEENRDPDEPLLVEAQQLVLDGNTVEALHSLRAAMRSRTVSLAVHELCHRLLRQAKWTEELREHACQYIDRLLREKQDTRALAVLREMLDADPEFAPLTREQTVQLVERTRQRGQFQLACDTLRAALRRWPDAPEAGDWAMEAGLLLAERFGRDEEARTLLLTARERCAEPSRIERIEATLRALSPAPTSAPGTAPA